MVQSQHYDFTEIILRDGHQQGMLLKSDIII